MDREGYGGPSGGWDLGESEVLSPSWAVESGTSTVAVLDGPGWTRNAGYQSPLPRTGFGGSRKGSGVTLSSPNRDTLGLIREPPEENTFSVPEDSHPSRCVDVGPSLLSRDPVSTPAPHRCSDETGPCTDRAEVVEGRPSSPSRPVPNGKR